MPIRKVMVLVLFLHSKNRHGPNFFCIDRDPKKNTDTSDPDIRLTYCCTLLEKLGGFPVPMYMTDYAKVNLCMQTF